MLELGIGAIGLAVLSVVPLLGGVYSAWAGSGPWSVVLRGLLAGLCLLPPTALMGATLPALARWVEATPRGVSWLGLFYAGNTFGAVVGSLLAGFYLLRLHDMPTATYVAVAINGAVAALAWMVARVTMPAAAPPEPVPAPGPRATRDISIAIALSGMTALAAEVVWTRLLSLLFGGTTYTFSLILASFLIGLGIGSAGGAAMARSLRRPRLAFGWCQAMLCVAIAWGGYLLTASLPFWPIDPSLAPSPWLEFHLDLARSLIVVLPAAILWGASFPLALAAVAGRGGDPARVVGGLYAANTLGAIVGSLGASLVVSALGSQQAQQLMVVACAASAILVLRPFALGPDRRAGLRFAAALAVIGVAGGLVLPLAIQPVPGSLVAYGRWAPTRAGGATIVYMGEGYNAAVAVSRLSNGVLNYHNAGKIQASSEVQDMRLDADSFRRCEHAVRQARDRHRRVVALAHVDDARAGGARRRPAPVGHQRPGHRLE